MRVQNIQNLTNNYRQEVQSKSSSNSMPNQRNMSRPQFGSGDWYPRTTWKTKALNILNRSQEEMNDLAEYFHKSDDETIKDASTIYFIDSVYFSIKKGEKSRKAYERLNNAVENVRRYKYQIIKELKNLKKSNNVDSIKRCGVLENEIKRLNEKAEKLSDYRQTEMVYVEDPEQGPYMP